MYIERPALFIFLSKEELCKHDRNVCPIQLTFGKNIVSTAWESMDR